MDQLTPEESRLFPAFLIGPMTRMGERIAAQEARSSAEIGALKHDTEIIRAAVHTINNALQVSAAAEFRASAELAKIADKMSATAELLTAKMSTQGEQIGGLMQKVDDLTAAKYRVEGGWWALVKGVAILTGVASIITAVSSIAWWLVQHAKFTG